LDEKEKTGDDQNGERSEKTEAIRAFAPGGDAQFPFNNWKKGHAS
jgi:hypothetical protein